MRRVYFVSAHFPPSNLAAVHRARLLANHLQEYGWEAHVLAVEPKYYEEPLDPQLEALVDPAVQVHRVHALSQRWTRPFGWGDIGIRAGFHLYRALRDAARRRAVDLLHITIPSNYQALLGRFLWEEHELPYIVDYIDPWAPESEQGARFPSKAWFSFWLAGWLEPMAVARVAGLAGVTEGYFAGVIGRNPGLRDVPRLAFQYGGSRRDFEMAASLGVAGRRVVPDKSAIQLVYAGALLPKAVSTMKSFLQAVAQVNRLPGRKRAIHFLCLGTGRSASDPAAYQVLPLARQVGAEAWVHEFPERCPYLEVLSTLSASDGIVVVGSSEPHYSPSKIFQAVLAGRPLLALLHHRSQGAEIIRQAGAGLVLTFDSDLEGDHLSDQCVQALKSWPPAEAPSVKWDAFERYEARAMAGRVARFYDDVLVYHRQNAP